MSQNSKVFDVESHIHNHEVNEQKSRMQMYEWIINFTVKACGRPEITAKHIQDKLLTKMVTLKCRKDSEHPKGKKNGFQVFGQSIGEEVKKACKENPSLNQFSENSRRWALLTDAEKERYNEMAKEDSLRYEDEMKKYNAEKFASDENFAAFLRQVEQDFAAGNETEAVTKFQRKTPAKNTSETEATMTSAVTSSSMTDTNDTTTTDTTTAANKKGRGSNKKNSVTASA